MTLVEEHAGGAGTGTARRARFAAASGEVAARLVREAVWEGEGCAWPLLPGETADPSRGADATLYSGAAGIGLFLAEAHAAGVHAEAGDTARGALERSLHGGAALPAHAFGFHAGRVGIAYAAVRSGLRLGADLRERAEALLRPLAGNEHADPGLDVVAGAAGAIPALLWLSAHLDPALTTEMALRLGERLRDAAHRLPAGWCWGALPAPAPPLCGYSHGASGMAHAFLELYRHTGDGEWRHAAEQALLYEARHFSPAHGNWPDLRDTAYSEYLWEGRMEELRAAIREGRGPSPSPPRYSCYWCHGAPGIGPVRLRAWEVLGAPRWREEARTALRTTAAALDALPGWSLCHGVAGSADALLAAAALPEGPALREAAEDAALAGIERHGGPEGRWPSGVHDSSPTPGLLLGEAGTGLFLLRLARPEVEPVLCVLPGAAGPPPERGETGYRAARAREVAAAFGPTLAAFRALGVSVEALSTVPAGEAPHATPAAEAYEAIRERVAAEPSPALRDRLEAAFAEERARHELLAAALDDRAEYRDLLARPAQGEEAASGARFVRSPRTRLVETPAGTRVLHRHGARVLAPEAGVLSVALLRALASPATEEEARDAVTAELGPDALPHAAEAVRAQLRALLAAGMAVAAPPP